MSSGEPNAKYTIDSFLNALIGANGSDLHCKVGTPPRVRVNGELKPLSIPPLTPEDTLWLLRQTMTSDKFEDFVKNNEADYSYQITGTEHRFRVNAYSSRGTAGLVMRKLASSPPGISELGLPEIINALSLEPRGLVLVTGPTGSGKTTTLSAVIDNINTNKSVNIVTIEDPIEILHKDKKGIVIQREIGQDSKDFKTAMRAALRQDPDVILIGEMRDQETVHAALSAAETGHLVLSTLHTMDAENTINRIVDFFPPNEQTQIRTALSESLRGIVSQRLLKRANNGGRVAALEILINSGRIREAIIAPNDNPGINELIADGTYYGMQTFDMNLFDLIIAGEVTIEDALESSTNPQDLRVRLRHANLLN